MPTSAPKPKRKPSAKRELALWKTQALSTVFKKCWAADSVNKSRKDFILVKQLKIFLK